jgi:hypothetical protein
MSRGTVGGGGCEKPYWVRIEMARRQRCIAGVMSVNHCGSKDSRSASLMTTRHALYIALVEEGSIAEMLKCEFRVAP